MTRETRLADFIALKFPSKTAFAKASGISPQQLYVYLKEGSRSPGADILQRWLDLGLSINWYLGGMGPMEALPEDVRDAIRSLDKVMDEIHVSLDEHATIALERAKNALVVRQEDAIRNSILNWLKEIVESK